jgi:hypothetical protein
MSAYLGAIFIGAQDTKYEEYKLTNVSAITVNNRLFRYKEDYNQSSAMALNWYGQTTINYKQILSFDFSLRNDFIKSFNSINKQSFLNYSLETAFVFSELNFLQNAEFLSHGKLRLSYSKNDKDYHPSILEIDRFIEFGSNLSFFKNRISTNF